MSKVKFNEETHTYTLDGIILPSVTQCLAPIAKFDGIPPAILEKARVRGDAVHKATELDDWGILDESSLMDAYKPYLEAWRKFRVEKKFVPELIEQRLYHKIHLYAGTPDRVGMMSGAERILLDIKASHEPPAYAGPQTAAYFEAFNHRRGKDKKATKTFTVHLQGDGNYNFIEHDPKEEIVCFLNCLFIYNWNQRRGIKQ